MDEPQHQAGDAEPRSPAVAVAVADAPAPTFIGPYRLVSLLGKGGMAQVFHAVREFPGGGRKTCAVKVPRTAALASPEMITQFMRESEIALMVEHNNVVRAFDRGTDKGVPYLVLDFVAGKNQAQVQRQMAAAGRTWSYDAVAHVAREAGSGLVYIHGFAPGGVPMNLVHRDLSSKNLLVSGDGGIYISDFGVASASIHRSEMSMFKGTWQYAAPEQIGGELGPWCDAFGLGTVLWEMIEMRAFRAGLDERTARLAAAAGNVPPLTRPDVPEGIRWVIEGLLAPDWKVRMTVAEVVRLMGGRIDARQEIRTNIQKLFGAAVTRTGHTMQEFRVPAELRQVMAIGAVGHGGEDEPEPDDADEDQAAGALAGVRAAGEATEAVPLRRRAPPAEPGGDAVTTREPGGGAPAPVAPDDAPNVEVATLRDGPDGPPPRLLTTMLAVQDVASVGPRTAVVTPPFPIRPSVEPREPEVLPCAVGTLETVRREDDAPEVCDAGPPTLTEPMVQRHSTLAAHPAGEGEGEGEGETPSAARRRVGVRIAGAVAGLVAVVIGLGAFTGWMITRGGVGDDATLAVDAAASDREVALVSEPARVPAPSLGPKLTRTSDVASLEVPPTAEVPAEVPAGVVAPVDAVPLTPAESRPVEPPPSDPAPQDGSAEDPAPPPTASPTTVPAVEPAARPTDVPPEKRAPRKATARLRLLTKHAQVRIGQRTIKMTDDGTHSIDLRVAAGRPAIGWRLTDADPWKTIRVVFGPGELVTVFVGRDGLRIGREKGQPGHP